MNERDFELIQSAKAGDNRALIVIRRGTGLGGNGKTIPDFHSR